MELSFETLELREICERSEKAQEVLGEEVAKNLLTRLADLKAADNILDLPLGNPTNYPDSGSSECKIDIDNYNLLIFCANHVNKLLTYSNSTEWAKIKRIKILKIFNGEKEHSEF